MVKKWEYDKNIDSLTLTLNNNRIVGSVCHKNFIFDLDKKGDIIGLEIDNFSEIFNSLKGGRS